MYGTGFGTHDCNPVTRAHTYQNDMLREAARRHRQAEATQTGPKESKHRVGVFVRLAQTVRSARIRQIAPAH